MDKAIKTQEEIQWWLRSRLATLMDVDVEEIDADEPIADYGIESIEAFTLSGDLADWLEIKVEPTLVWDFPTVSAISLRLATTLSESGSSTN